MNGSFQLPERQPTPRINIMFTRKSLCIVLPLLLIVSNLWAAQAPDARISGTIEKMLVGSGKVTLQVDVARLNGGADNKSKSETLNFGVSPDSFFTVLV